jgi:glycosyltransferase involved in cell wall biosynthesis
MKNVLFVVDERKMGGVSVLLSDMLNGINLDNIHVDVAILHNNGDMLKNLPKEVNIIYGTKVFKTVDYTLKEALSSKKISNIINKVYLIFAMKTGLIKGVIKRARKRMFNKQYDIEIAFKDGFCGLFTGYGNSLKKIQWLHCDYEMKDHLANYKKRFIKLYDEALDTIVGISKPVKDRFNKIYGCANKTIVINNMVPTDVIKTKSKEYKVKAFNKDVVNIVSVGRFHEMKGYPRLIEVVKKLKDSNLKKDFHVRLIGTGPEFNLCKELVKKYELTDTVELLGEMKNPFPYVSNSDLFILGSFYEPFGLTVIESLSLGVPVLATDVASIHEMLDSKSGYIVENSEEGLYNKLVKLINDSSTIYKLKDNLKEYEYDNKKIIDDINKLLGVNEDKKISIIIPVYNVAKYIGICLDSLVKQTYKNIEIIVVDDGSTDDSLKIIKDYEKKYPKLIKALSEKNSGPSSARNLGLKHATGEYISFVDSDDYIDKNCYEILSKKLDIFDYDMVVYNHYFEFENCTKDGSSKISKDLYDKDKIRKMLVNFYPVVWNKLFKKELFVNNNINFKEGVWYEDVEFLYRIMPFVGSIGVVNNRLYHYVQRPGAITKTYNDKLFNYLDNWNGIVDFYKQHNLLDKYKNEICYSYVRYIYGTLIKESAKSNNKELFNKAVDEAIKNVKRQFPWYRKNKYFYHSLKGIYMVLFSKGLAKVIFMLASRGGKYAKEEKKD